MVCRISTQVCHLGSVHPKIRNSWVKDGHVACGASVGCRISGADREVIGQRDTVKWQALLLPAPCHARKMLSKNFLEAGVANRRMITKPKT